MHSFKNASLSTVKHTSLLPLKHDISLFHCPSSSRVSSTTSAATQHNTTTTKTPNAEMDAMDVDWCLTCNKQTTHGKPYCSKTCKMRGDGAADAYAQEISCISDDASSSSDVLRKSPAHQQQQQRPHTSSRRHTHPSSSRQHQQRSPRRTHTHTQVHAPQQQFLDAESSAYAQWAGYNEAGIRAWASAIPAGCASVETPSIGLGLSYTCARPEFPLSRQRPAGPALCTDTTQPARTTVRSSSPISLPSPRAASAHDDVHASYSMSSYSLVSALTESIVTPESAHPHTKAHVRAGNGNATGTGRPGVLEGLARRFRAWGAGAGAPALKHDTPAEIFMQTTTTTVPASPSPSSPSSPVPRASTTKSNSKGSASGFTVRGCGGDANDDEHHHQQQQQGVVFAVRLPLAGARSPLTIGDAELKDSLASGLLGAGAEQPKRGVWIAGREKADKGWAGFGPAYYEKDYRVRMPMGSVDERSEREFREHEAWAARGRKTVRR